MRRSTGVDPLARLRGSMEQLQKDAERVLSRTRKQAAGLISRDQKRALDRLVSQARRLRDDLERRARRAQKEVETRAERMLGGIEHELTKRVEPLLRRLDIPTRKEIQALAKRIGQLEKHPRGAVAAKDPDEATAVGASHA
ncbi:MAG TPA: phasin family protein [Candidatus Binatia bacterium]|nr:phasin family protein [Candidatus Binatia bacterium]